MSGSRLPGDSSDTDRHKTDVRADTRLKGNLADRFEQYVEDTGKSKAEVLREALDESLPDLDDDGVRWVTPRDPDLRSAYLALAVEDTKRVLPVPEAVDILASTSHPSTPKDRLRDFVLPRLAESGLLGVSGGAVAVHPLVEASEVDLL